MSYIPGTASLVEELDKKIMVVLRDGRKIIGMFRSFDQFANLVLQSAVERHIVGKRYGDIPVGLYVVRGDNVALLGEVDPAREHPPQLQQVSAKEILQAEKEEQEGNLLKTQMLKKTKEMEEWLS